MLVQQRSKQQLQPQSGQENDAHAFKSVKNIDFYTKRHLNFEEELKKTQLLVTTLCKDLDQKNDRIKVLEEQCHQYEMAAIGKDAEIAVLKQNNDVYIKEGMTRYSEHMQNMAKLRELSTKNENLEAAKKLLEEKLASRSPRRPDIEENSFSDSASTSSRQIQQIPAISSTANLSPSPAHVHERPEMEEPPTKRIKIEEEEEEEEMIFRPYQPAPLPPFPVALPAELPAELPADHHQQPSAEIDNDNEIHHSPEVDSGNIFDDSDDQNDEDCEYDDDDNDDMDDNDDVSEDDDEDEDWTFDDASEESSSTQPEEDSQPLTQPRSGRICFNQEEDDKIIEFIFHTSTKLATNIKGSKYWREATKLLQSIRPIDRTYLVVRQRFSKILIKNIHLNDSLNTKEHRAIAFECFRTFLKGKERRQMRAKYDEQKGYTGTPTRLPATTSGPRKLVARNWSIPKKPKVDLLNEKNDHSCTKSDKTNKDVQKKPEVAKEIQKKPEVAKDVQKKPQVVNDVQKKPEIDKDVKKEPEVAKDVLKPKDTPKVHRVSFSFNASARTPKTSLPQFETESSLEQLFTSENSHMSVPKEPKDIPKTDEREKIKFSLTPRTSLIQLKPQRILELPSTSENSPKAVPRESNFSNDIPKTDEREKIKFSLARRVSCDSSSQKVISRIPKIPINQSNIFEDLSEDSSSSKKLNDFMKPEVSKKFDEPKKSEVSIKLEKPEENKETEVFKKLEEPKKFKVTMRLETTKEPQETKESKKSEESKKPETVKKPEGKKESKKPEEYKKPEMVKNGGEFEKLNPKEEFFRNFKEYRKPLTREEYLKYRESKESKEPKESRMSSSERDSPRNHEIKKKASKMEFTEGQEEFIIDVLFNCEEPNSSSELGDSKFWARICKRFAKIYKNDPTPEQMKEHFCTHIVYNLHKFPYLGQFHHRVTALLCYSYCFGDNHEEMHKYVDIYDDQMRENTRARRDAFARNYDRTPTEAGEEPEIENCATWAKINERKFKSSYHFKPKNFDPNFVSKNYKGNKPWNKWSNSRGTKLSDSDDEQ